MRDRLIFIAISNSLQPRTGTAVVGYSILLADGRPLPKWIDVAENGLLLVDPPVGIKEVDIKIYAQMSDGQAVTRAISLQLRSGEVQELQIESSRPSMFEEQMQQRRAN